MQGETILCIATRVWNSLWRSTQQTISRIAVQNRVLYFEPGRNPDQPYSVELWRNLPNFLQLRFRELHGNLVLIQTPSCLPYTRRHLPRSVLQFTTPLVAKINAWILIRHVRRALKAFNIEEPVLWLYEPRHIHLLGKFGERLVCYYNYDEYADFVHNARIKELVRDFDDRLSRKADVVFATSRGQWERRRILNPHTYFIPNGVDFALYTRALDPHCRIAPQVANLSDPIIGYAGWLGYQVDVDLLLRVSEAYPDCSLVLVGPDCLPDSIVRRRLRAMPNVFFLGRKDLTSLPEYLKSFDVALIPYVVGGHTLTVYPLKLHEYLAAGLATVATALPELEPYSHVVRIGRTHDEFIDHIRQTLDEHDPQRVEAGVSVAQENTWDHRVADIYRILETHIAATARRR